MSDKRVFVFLYAKDCEKYSWEPDDYAKRRCCVASKLIYQFPNSKIVLGAGCERLCIGRSVKNLSESLMKYLTEILGIDKNRIIINPVGKNTVEETIAMVNAVGGFKKSDKIIVVSSWFHIPRILLIWVVGYFKIVYFRFSYGIFKFVDLVHEFFGIPKSILEAVVKIHIAKY